MRETVVKTEEFKDSPLGKIPKDWDVVTVESIAADKPYAVVDGPFGSNLKTEHYREYGIPVIQSGFVTSGVFLAESYVYVDRALFQAQKRSAVEPGDIVMAKIGAQCGTSAILPANHPVGILAGNSLKISTNSDRCRTDYLLRILHYYYDTGQIDLIKTETAQPAISLKNLRALKIPLPPCVKEQDAITSILDALDKTIAHTSSLIAKLKLMKAGLLHDLLTRGLDENGEVRDAIGHPEQFKDSPLGQIPKDWNIYNTGAIATIKYGINDAVDQSLESGVLTITLPCVSKTGELTLDKELLALSARHKVRDEDILQAGDLLFNWRNGSQEHLGKTAYFKATGEYTHVGFLLRIRANPELCDSRYLWWRISYMKSEGLFLRAKSQVNNTFNSAELANMRVIVPPIPEQQRIVKALEPCEHRIRTEEAYRDKLKLQKQGLMHDLLTGKVRVNCLGDK